MATRHAGDKESRPPRIEVRAVTDGLPGPPRLHVKWWADDEDAFRAVKDSFRRVFPQRSAVYWLPADKAWSIRWQDRGKLAAWIAVTFPPSAVDWDEDDVGSASAGGWSGASWFHTGTRPAPGGRLASAYAALYLLPTAPAEVVQAAHRALVKVHHPDHGGDGRAIIGINRAIEEIRAG